MPNFVLALLPMLRLVGRDLDRRDVIDSRQRDRFLSEREAEANERYRNREDPSARTASAKTPSPPRRRSHRAYQAEEQTGILAKMTKSALSNAAQPSRSPAASSQAEAPPAITKKSRPKLRRIISVRRARGQAAL
jgi:hypothetical protein